MMNDATLIRHFIAFDRFALLSPDTLFCSECEIGILRPTNEHNHVMCDICATQFVLASPKERSTPSSNQYLFRQTDDG